MKKIVLFILLMLPVAVMGQKMSDEMTFGQIFAVGNTLNSLPQIDSLRYIIQEGDTIWEGDENFLGAVVYKACLSNSVNNICGITFGSSFEESHNALEKKFGHSTYSTNNSILYKGITYSGEFFDNVIFFFQHERDKSYLSQVIFTRDVKSMDDAIQTKQSFQEKLSRKYTSIYRVDEELTVGGLPPLPFLKPMKIDNPRTTYEMGFGFEIKILSNDNYKFPYFVRIMYGPYEYVKEDF